MFITDNTKNGTIDNNPWAGIFLYKNGVLFWTTGRNFGRIAGSYNSAGIHIIKYQNQQYTTARIIYEMHHGLLDHNQQVTFIDGDKTNRRIENLTLTSAKDRSVTSIDNKIETIKKELDKLTEYKHSLNIDQAGFFEEAKKVIKQEAKLKAAIAKLQAKKEQKLTPQDNATDTESLIPDSKITSDFIKQGAAMLDSLFKAAE